MKRILTFGVFDFFHLGHLRLFKQCKKYGDYLIVAVQDENYIHKYKPQSKILYSVNERMELISALKVVDKVIIYKMLNIETLEKIDFDVLALGEDHIGPRFDSLEKWCKKNQKEIVRLKRTKGICSSKIKTKF